MPVFEHLDGADIKGDLVAALPEQHRSGLLGAVAGPDFVEDVGVKPADVREGHAAVHDAVEHLLGDGAGKGILVGSCRDQILILSFGSGHTLDGRLKDQLVDAVEINVFPSDIFFAEGHDHKTGSLQLLEAAASTGCVAGVAAAHDRSIPPAAERCEPAF